MELLKVAETPAEFPWKDITIFYRKRVTVGDKFAVDTAGAAIKDDKVEFTPWEFYKTLIRLFVTGWKGVVQDGKDVPYSFPTLLSLPSDTAEDLIMKLGYKIAQDTGFFDSKEDGTLKNESGGPSNG